MKLKKDWTLGHFLYYTSWFTIIGIILQFVSISFPVLFGSNSIMTLKEIDPPIAISAKSLSIDHNFYQQDGSYLALPLHIYTYPMVVAEKADFTRENLLIHGARLLKMGTLVFFFLMLARVLKTVIKKNPFEQKNSGRVFYMGISVIFLPLLSLLQGYLFQRTFNNVLIGSDFEFSISLLGSNQGSLTFGLSLVLLSYVFKEANRIHEEQKLTV